MRDSQPSFILGVDIGGTKVATLVVDGAGAPVASLLVPTDRTSPEATLSGVLTAIEQTLAQANLRPDQLHAVGMGVPGRVNSVSGEVDLAVNLNWHGIALGATVSERLGVPCFLENDVRAAALGVYRFCLERPVASFAYISVGTGISAGIIFEGHLHRGARGMAGEIGHISLERSGPRCPCGLRGCLETLAAGPAIASQAQIALAAGRPSLLQQLDHQQLTAADVYAAAAANDALACEITTQAGRYIAQAIHQIALTCDIEHIVLGGGVAQARDEFLRPIRRELAQMAAESPLVESLIDPSAVRLVPAGYAAGCWGAVAVAEAGVAATLTLETVPQQEEVR